MSHPTRPSTTVEQLLNLLLAGYQADKRPVAQQLAYSLPNMARYFGDRDVDSIGFADFERYKAWRIAAGKSPKTVNNELGYLVRASRLGRRAGLCSSIFDVEKFTIGLTNARTDFIQPEQLRAILRGLEWNLQHVVEFAYLTGWRKQEILTLQWSAVDRKEGVITLEASRSKNRHARLAPISDRVATILERRERVRAGPLVFHRQGKQIKCFARAWKTATERAGCPGVVFHACRRSFVRNGIRAGIDRDVVMALSGHKSDAVFRRYNITSEDDLKAGARKMATYIRNREPSRGRDEDVGLATG